MQASGVNTVLLVDTSRSMRSGDLFERVRSNVKDYIRELHVGDHLLILSFDQDVIIVFDDEIRASEDLSRAERSVSEIRATGDWTYMTKALDHAATQARRLQTSTPKRRHQLYLFTDGHNDPPPPADPQDSMITFEDVLRKHFDFFASRDTFMFVLSLREPRQDLGGFTEKVKQARISRAIRHEMREIEMALAKTDLGSFTVNRGQTQIVVPIQVRRLINAPSTKLSMITQVDGLPQGLTAKLESETIVVQTEGQAENRTITISGKPSRDDYRLYRGVLELKSESPDVNLTTPHLAFSFTLVNGGRGGELWLQLSVLVAALLAISIVIYRALRPPRFREVWVSRDGHEPVHAVVRSRAKLPLAIRSSGEYLDFALPNYYVALDRDHVALLCREQPPQKLRVDFKREMICDAGGVTTKLRFYDRNPQKTDMNPAAEQEKALPSPFWRME